MMIVFNKRDGRMEMRPDVMSSQDDPNIRARVKQGEAQGAATGKEDVEQHSSAVAAGENIEKIDKLLTHLKESSAITGMGSDFLKNVERTKVFFLNSQKAGKKVSDTELLNALLGSEVFPMIKSLGIGARGLDTPAEREFLRSVMTGQTSMNKDTLIRMAEIRRDIAQRAVDRWNNRIKKGELNPYFSRTGRTQELVGQSAPTNSAPMSLDEYLKSKGK